MNLFIFKSYYENLIKYTRLILCTPEVLKKDASVTYEFEKKMKGLNINKCITSLFYPF